jgi:hypothetical protein
MEIENTQWLDQDFPDRFPGLLGNRSEVGEFAQLVVFADDLAVRLFQVSTSTKTAASRPWSVTITAVRVFLRLAMTSVARRLTSVTGTSFIIGSSLGYRVILPYHSHKKSLLV